MASSSNQKRPLDESTSDKETQHQMIKRQTVNFDRLLDISPQKFEKTMEQLFRKVVSEELDSAVTRHFGPRLTRSPSLRIQAPEPFSLHLAFAKRPLKASLFTLNKLTYDDGSPLRVMLIDPKSDKIIPFPSGGSIKIQIVVLRGDFPTKERWSAEEFKNGILHARSGKPPLITGKLTQTVKPGAEAWEFTDLAFTDNSRWTRSRKFRVGAQVAGEGQHGHYAGFRILEAVSEGIVVRDRRSESSKKHYPPKLSDEVWRLVKISKGRLLHSKLSSEGISTVQDFLKMSVVYPDKLREILGTKMTSRKWKSVKDHANTCEMGDTFYVYDIPSLTHQHNQICSLVLDPMCHAVAAQISGQTILIQQFTTFLNMDEDLVVNLVKEAYLNWNSVQKVDRVLIESAITLV